MWLRTSATFNTERAWQEWLRISTSTLRELARVVADFYFNIERACKDDCRWLLQRCLLVVREEVIGVDISRAAPAPEVAEEDDGRQDAQPEQAAAHEDVGGQASAKGTRGRARRSYEHVVCRKGVV